MSAISQVLAIAGVTILMRSNVACAENLVQYAMKEDSDEFA